MRATKDYGARRSKTAEDSSERSLDQRVGGSSPPRPTNSFGECRNIGLPESALSADFGLNCREIIGRVALPLETAALEIQRCKLISGSFASVRASTTPSSTS